MRPFTAKLTGRIVRVMRCSAFLLFCSIAGVTACSGPRRTVAARQAEPPAPPEPYVRVEQTDSNQIRLQIAAREFVPRQAGEPTIWLTGVAHIGDSNYYAALQAHLDEQTLVLFEGVGSAASAPDSSAPDTDTSAPARASPDERGSLQSAMAAALGLVFQLEAIDYHRQNFRNSDLSLSQLRDLMSQSETESGKPGASESFEDLVQMMEGDSWFDALLQMALRLLGANPKFQALGRLALIDLLSGIQGDPSRLQGLPPGMKQLLEVLLQRRNEKVLSDLKSALPQIGRHGSVAVFFGTGHMPDLERKLEQQLRYRPRREIWFTVFQADLAAAKVSPSERQLVDTFVAWQLKEAGASSRH